MKPKTNHRAGGRFWIIDLDCPGDSDKSHTACGPFATVADAELYLRQEGAAVFATSDKPLCEIHDMSGWSAPVHIVEVRKTVKQVPIVKVSCALLPA